MRCSCKLKVFSAIFLIVGLVLILSVPEALAQTSTQTPPQTPPPMGAVLFRMVPMFIIVFGMFYFLVIRPQKQELDQKAKLIAGLKKGDSVVTSGGILGVVVNLTDEHVTVGVENGGKLKIEREHIVKRTTTDTSTK